jgi:DNA-binding NarL/FixJ family response regulator
MLSNSAKTALTNALSALQTGDAGAWRALAPLSALAASGTSITIDFTTEAELGAPLIIARTPTNQCSLPACLTPRQREVAAALGKGLSNKEIARKLQISPATVKDHVGVILAAVGLTSRAAFIAKFHGAIL